MTGRRALFGLAALLLPGGCHGPSSPAPSPVGEIPGDASPLLAGIARPARQSALTGGRAAGLFFAGSINQFDPDPLVGSPAIFQGMTDAVEGAEREVLFQTYRLEADSDPARALWQGLTRLDARRARLPPDLPPVEVRILVDVLTPRRPAHLAMPALARAVEALGLDPTRVKVVLGAHTHLRSDSHHAKSLVIDGRRAIVTGANGDRPFDFAGPWFDAGYRMEGTIAGALREEQIDAWSGARQWVCGGRLREEIETEHCLVEPEPAPGSLEGEGSRDGEGSPIPALLVTRAAHSGSGGLDDPLDQALLAAFGSALSTIRIQTPDLNSRAGVDSLVEAARRGVEVDLVLSKGFNELAEELPGQGGTNEKVIASMRESLRRAGVEHPCDRLKVRWFSSDGLHPVEGKLPGASHAKFFAIDEAVVMVGSANMDTQSWAHSREILVAVDDPGITRAWTAAVFTPSFQRGVPADPCS